MTEGKQVKASNNRRNCGVHIPPCAWRTGEEAIWAAETIALGGIPIVELTLTIPGVLEVIGRLRRDHPGIVVGAGTVLDMAAAKRCVDAGAMFLTSPGLVQADRGVRGGGECSHHAGCADADRSDTGIAAARITSRYFPARRWGVPSLYSRDEKAVSECRFIASAG